VAVGAIVATQEPSGPSVAAVIAGASVVAASVASLTLLRYAAVGRSARARASRVRALRRGVELGAVVGLIATLRVIDGLTPLTALFVVLSFAIAEYVLSAGASSSA
jgi:hypothetical protein